MKTSHKIIVTSLLVATVPAGLFAYDKYKNEHRTYKSEKHMDYDRKHNHNDHNEYHHDDRYKILPKGANYIFEGKLEALPKDGLNGTWLISGKKVIVDDNTKIYQDKKFNVRDEIEVIGKREGNTIKALEIVQD